MKRIASALLIGWMSSAALAAGYNEKSSGDLSDERLTPTPVATQPGSNIVTGRFGSRAGSGVDLDYFTIKIAAGQTLDAIILGAGTDVGGAVSFIGVQRGKKMTVPPDGGDPSGLLGWDHFGTLDEGTDLLPAIGAGPGAQGFVPPLGPGTYTFWLQELSTCKCKFQLDFQVGGGAR